MTEDKPRQVRLVDLINDLSDAQVRRVVALLGLGQIEPVTEPQSDAA